MRTLVEGGEYCTRMMTARPDQGDDKEMQSWRLGAEVAQPTAHADDLGWLRMFSVQWTSRSTEEPTN